MTMLDRVKRMTSLVVNVPGDIEKLSVIIETKTSAVESALKREAAALEKAMTPEMEAELEKLEGLLSHIPGLAGLVKAHGAVEGVADRVVSAVEAAVAPSTAPAPAEKPAAPPASALPVL